MSPSRLLMACVLLALPGTPAFAWLHVGDPAPEVSGITETGARLKFAALYARGNTLVYFFPQAGTPDCTTQGCNLRDAFEDFLKVGVTIIGVSHDAPAVLQAFKEKNQLPFLLISDQDEAVSKAFWVPNQSGTHLAKRQSFLINQAGLVVWCDFKSSAKTLPQDVLHAVARLRSTQGNLPMDMVQNQAYQDQMARDAMAAQQSRSALNPPTQDSLAGPR